MHLSTSMHVHVRHSLIFRHMSSATLPVRKAYDLVVIGSGPSAIKCAFDASKRGKSVAMIDKKAMIGGVCVVRANMSVN